MVCGPGAETLRGGRRAREKSYGDNWEGEPTDEFLERNSQWRRQFVPGGAEPMVRGPGAETPLGGDLLLPVLGVVCSRVLGV